MHWCTKIITKLHFCMHYAMLLIKISSRKLYFDKTSEDQLYYIAVAREETIMEIKSNYFDNVSFGFAVLDDKLNVKYLNKKLSTVLERTPTSLIGDNIYNLISSLPDISLTENHISQYVTFDNGQALLIDIVKINNGLHYLFCQGHPKYDHILEQIAITSKKRIINDKMLDCLYDGCYITDGAGETLYVNDSFLEMSGLKREEVLGKKVQGMVEDKTLPKSCTMKVLETGKPASMMMNYPKGRNCLVTGAPVYIDGKIERVICTSRDMTELIAMQYKLANVTSLTISLKHQLREFEFQHGNKYVSETRSKVMANIFDKAIKVASLDTPVLILGETGVGKDFLVRFMHNVPENSTERFLIKVNCGAIPENLLESELFGYEAGAFTGASKQGKAGLFELANNGTLFLDEIGDMPLPLQVKLLDVIQDKSFYRLGGTKMISANARIIAATNLNLERLISEGKFRSDLYYRLNVIKIAIPPLRERKEDIIPLAALFLEEFNSKYHKSCYFAPKLLNFFMNYRWAGNIREMKNTIERLVIMSDKECIELDMIKEQIIDSYEYTNPYEREMLNKINGHQKDDELRLEKGTLQEQMEAYEALVIKKRIEESPTLKKAARSLGIDSSTLLRKKYKYNIDTSVS
ncbi:MAG: Limonene hydroxylase [Smithella sp. PtaU1.Bin162]|nr:MAG: Limonene hydroxylase [Smithella sp. PtaU1.Bin162]